MLTILFKNGAGARFLCEEQNRLGKLINVVYIVQIKKLVLVDGSRRNVRFIDLTRQWDGSANIWKKANFGSYSLMRANCQDFALGAY